MGWSKLDRSLTALDIGGQAASGTRRGGPLPSGSRLVADQDIVHLIYPLTATETQLDVLGRYEPPMGVLGDAVDAVVGNRIAEASVHRFIADVATYLRTHLAK